MYLYPKQKTFSDSFTHACFAAMNAGTAFALASMALGHLNTQVCVDLRDASSTMRSRSTFCLPTAHTIKYAKQVDAFTAHRLGSSFSDPFLNFATGVAAILSLYCTQQAYRHCKAVF